MHSQTLEAAPLPPNPPQVTALLDAWGHGDPGALERLTPLVIDDLRRLARSFMARQPPGHTLQPTALVNEAYLRLLGAREASWESRRHFFAYMATTMRRLLVNHARDRGVAKRGGTATHVALDEVFDQPAGARRVHLLDLDRALEGLAAVDPRQARIVELRYFGGLTVEETGEALGISARTVKREWRTARLWLLRALEGR
jgi:RNA polymerase sigma factor (TIGR02999 family)